MTPLARLLAAVEAGEWPNKVWADGSDVPAMVLGFSEDRYALSAYHGSTDAAISLVDAVLPGWIWCVRNLPEPDSDFHASIYLQAATDVDSDIYVQADTPARALLIAALRALVAQEGATP